MLNSAYQRVDSAKASGGFPCIETIPEIDKVWIETTTVKANNRLEALLAEFKRQKDEAVKVLFLNFLQAVHQKNFFNVFN
jgi:hypothetical protein